MKYSRSLTSVVVFRLDPPRGGSARSAQGRIHGGSKVGHGVPFFKELLLQTGRLRQIRLGVDPGQGHNRSIRGPASKDFFFRV